MGELLCAGILKLSQTLQSVLPSREILHSREDFLVGTRSTASLYWLPKCWGRGGTRPYQLSVAAWLLCESAGGNGAKAPRAAEISVSTSWEKPLAICARGGSLCRQLTYCPGPRHGESSVERASVTI